MFRLNDLGSGMRVSKSVRALQVPDDSPMHPVFTNIFYVGGDQSLTIDSGEMLERYRWMLKGYLAAIEKTEIALAAITHHHSDHSGNLKWIREFYDAEILIPHNARPLLKGKLPARGVKKIQDGENIDLGKGVKVTVLQTPGHSVDSICFYLESEGVLFTGDTILGSTTTTVQNLAEYRESLQYLVDLPNLKVICPGHGPLIEEPRERLTEYIAHRNLREEQIIDVLRKNRQVTSWEIMLEIYPQIDTRLRRAADSNVQSHLEQLKNVGLINETSGIPKKNRSKQQVSVKDKEHERIIRQAERFKTARIKAQIRAQESPPSDVWKVPPKYEMS